MKSCLIALAGVVGITCACASGQTPGGPPGMRAKKVPKAKRVLVAFTVINDVCVIVPPDRQTLDIKRKQETKLYWEVSNECDSDVRVNVTNFVRKDTQAKADPFTDDPDDGGAERTALLKPGKVRQIHVDVNLNDANIRYREYKYDVLYTVGGASQKRLDPDVIIEWP